MSRDTPSTEAGRRLADYLDGRPMLMTEDYRRLVAEVESEARQQDRDQEPPPEIDVERLAAAMEQGFQSRWFARDIGPDDIQYLAAAIATEYERLSRGPQVRGGG